MLFLLGFPFHQKNGTSNKRPKTCFRVKVGPETGLLLEGKVSHNHRKSADLTACGASLQTLTAELPTLQRSLHVRCKWATPSLNAFRNQCVRKSCDEKHQQCQPEHILGTRPASRAVPRWPLMQSFPNFETLVAELSIGYARS